MAARVRSSWLRSPALVLASLLATAAPTSWAQQAKEPATGTWRGPIQFVLKNAKGEIPEAHIVADGVIEIASDGKVRGVITGAGCTILGLGREFVTPQSASLDVLFKQCTDERFNRRYTGHLTDGGAGKPKTLALTGMGTLNLSAASLSGVMRR